MDDEEQVDALEAETEVPVVEAVEEEVSVPAERELKPAPKGKKPRKLKVVDAFANGAIPAGATGPSVDRLRAQLGMPGAGPLDRRVSNAVRAWQASNGLTPTGRVDAVTRRSMGV